MAGGIDGGYFNNAGSASIASHLRVLLPTIHAGAGARPIRTIVLLLASDVPASPAPPGLLQGSLASAIIEPAAVLAQTGDAHEATYRRQITELFGEDTFLLQMRPPGGSREVALGWSLSDATRCDMDGMVNTVVNDSEASRSIASELGAHDSRPQRGRSCDVKGSPIANHAQHAEKSFCHMAAFGAVYVFPIRR